MRRIIAFFFFLLSFSRLSYSQEQISDLTYRFIPEMVNHQIPERGHSDTLALPFIDDFSNYRKSFFPDHALWLDSNVYLNNNYPINPVTVGVATFEGLDKFGKPYQLFPANSKGSADFLTSRPIDLSGLTNADSVYLSFYYQPQGRGNDPQLEDVFNVEFYNPVDSLWKTVLSIDGSSVTEFKIAMLPVSDPFLQNGFQFRFNNYATLSGNLDHWHLDYVKLDKNRSAIDTMMKDLGFKSNIDSITESYYTIPWEHYKQAPGVFLRDSFNVLANNSIAGNISVTFSYKIEANDRSMIAMETANENFPLGEVIVPKSAFTQYWPQAYSVQQFFPVDANPTASFRILHTMEEQTSLDSYHNNDTVEFIQRFYNYYAYDDGTAESAYGLTQYGAALAYEFNTNISDTLEAVNIYFNQVLSNVSENPFRICIWRGENGPQGNPIYIHPTDQYPSYENTLDGFVRYNINDLHILSGKYYIGMIQTGNQSLNIGLDKNRNSASKIWYNTAGTFIQTSFNGHALMMRPVFGDAGLPVSAEERKPGSTSIKLYPNPTTGKITIDSEISQFNLFDITGKQVYSRTDPEKEIDLSGLNQGVYFASIVGKDHSIHTQKLIITK